MEIPSGNKQIISSSCAKKLQLLFENTSFFLDSNYIDRSVRGESDINFSCPVETHWFKSLPNSFQNTLKLNLKSTTSGFMRISPVIFDSPAHVGANPEIEALRRLLFPDNSAGGGSTPAGTPGIPSGSGGGSTPGMPSGSGGGSTSPPINTQDYEKMLTFRNSIVRLGAALAKLWEEPGEGTRRLQKETEEVESREA